MAAEGFTFLGVPAGTYADAGHHHAGADIDSGTVAYGRLPVGTAASTVAIGDHAHTHANWQPADHNLKAWAFDPVVAVSSTAPTDGVLQLIRVRLAAAATVTNIVLCITVAGTSLTTGNNIAGLWTAAGTKIDVTGDQTTTWASTGNKTMPLAGGAYSAAAGDYYIGFWANGTGTDPSFLRGTSTAAGNVGLAAPNLRFATANTGLTNAASAPGTLGTQTATVFGWWAALS